MADNGHIYGFRPVKTLHGDALPAVFRGAVASGYTGMISVGDPVKRLSTGYWQLATNGAAFDGVCCRIFPYFNGTRMTFGTNLPSATTYGTNFERQSFIGIMPAQRTVFEADCDDATSITTYANYLDAVGENVDIVIGNGASNVAANPLLDISTHATTNTLTMRIVGISELNFATDPAGTFFKLYVIPNLTSEAPWTATGT